MDNKNSMESDTKKLSLVVVFLSLFVVILFGLVPLI